MVVFQQGEADSGSAPRLLGNLLVMERYTNTVCQGLAASGLKISSGLECADGLLWDYREGHAAPLALNRELDYTKVESQVHQTALLQEWMRNIQSGLRTASSALPDQYELLRNEYKNYAIFPKQYAAELLAY